MRRGVCFRKDAAVKRHKALRQPHYRGLLRRLLTRLWIPRILQILHHRPSNPDVVEVRPGYRSSQCLHLRDVARRLLFACAVRFGGFLSLSAFRLWLFLERVYFLMAARLLPSTTPFIAFL